MPVVDVIKDSASFFMKRPLAVVPTFAFLAFIGIAIVCLIIGGGVAFAVSGMTPALFAAAVVAIFALILIAMVVGAFTQLATLELYAAFRSGKNISLSEAFTRAKPLVKKVVYNSLYVVALFIVLFAAAIIAGIALFLLASVPILGVLIAFLLGVVAVVAFFAFMLALAFTGMLALVLTREEHVHGLGLVKRAIEIAREHWFRLMFLYAVVIAASMIVRAPMEFAMFLGASPFLLIPFGCVTLVLVLALTAWNIVLYAEFYYAYAASAGVNANHLPSKGKVERYSSNDEPAKPSKRAASKGSRSKKIVASKGKRISKN